MSQNENEINQNKEKQMVKLKFLVDMFKFVLDQGISKGGSDIILASGYMPSIVLGPETIPFSKIPINGGEINYRLTNQDLLLFIKLILDSRLNKEDLWENLKNKKYCDTGYVFGKQRFRVNIHTFSGPTGGGDYSIILRIINNDIPTMEQLNLPESYYKLLSYGQGLVLVVGETGSGKSTTLAAMIDRINNTKNKHIITLEDPVEYKFEAQGGTIIEQKELGVDFISFPEGIKSALREKPQILLLGEMRDEETIKSAVELANTGHLVFGTFHGGDTVKALSRLSSYYPNEKIGYATLSSTIIGIITQKLLGKVGGGKVLCNETCFFNDAIRNLVFNGKIQSLPTYINESREDGNVLFDTNLKRLYQEGKIDEFTFRSNILDRTNNN